MPDAEEETEEPREANSSAEGKRTCCLCLWKKSNQGIRGPRVRGICGF